MSSYRRAVVQLRLDGEEAAWVQVGARTLYHYWALLGTHFKSVFLPPFRKTDGTGVSWTWDEPPGAALPTAEELKEVRRRISESHRRFIDAVGDGPSPATGNLSPEDLEELRARMGKIVANFVAKSDRELIGYCARAGSVWMVHSWGAPSPEDPVYPDELVLSVSGKVLVDDSPLESCEVVLLDGEGAEAGATRSDRSGRFSFSKLHPGAYRVRGISDRVDFPEAGVVVVLEQEAVSDVLIQAQSRKSAPLEVKGDEARGDRGSGGAEASSPWRLFGLLALLLLAAGAAWWFYVEHESTPPVKKADRGPAGVWHGEGTPENAPASEKPAANGTVGDPGVSSSNKPARKVLVSGGGDIASADVYARASEAVKGAHEGGSPPETPVQGAGSGSGSPAKQTGKAGAPGTPSSKNGGPAPAVAKPWAKTRAVEAVPSENSGGKSASVPQSVSDSKLQDPGAASPTTPPRRPVAPSEGSPASEGQRDGAEQGHEGEMVKPPFSGTPPPEPTPGADRRGKQPEPKKSPSTQKNEPAQGAQPSPVASKSGGDRSGQAPVSKPVSTPSSESAGEATEPVKPENVKAADSGKRQSPPSNAGDAGPGAVETPQAASSDPEASGKQDPASSPLKSAPSGNSVSSSPPLPRPDARDNSSAATFENGNANATKQTQKSGGAAALERPSPTPSGEAGWQPAVRILQERWTVALAADEILETVPGEQETDAARLENLRLKRLQALRNQMSDTFRRREVWVGVSFSVPSIKGNLGLHWKGQPEASARSGFLPKGSHMDLSWREGALRKTESWTLLDNAGVEWVRVRLGADGDCLYLARDGVRANYWVGVERAPGEDSFGDRASWSDRLRWQSGREAFLPDGWERDDDWHGGKGHRLEIPLDPSEGDATWTIRLLDTDNRWCIRGRVAVTLP